MADAADSKSVAAIRNPLKTPALANAGNEPTVTPTVAAPEIDDARLAAIVAAWGTLPEAVRLAVLAVVNSAKVDG